MTLTILRAYIGPHREIDADTELLSLGLTDGHKECIAAEIEDACGVEISEDQARAWRTVGDLLGVGA
ncbi:hypothetical protein F1640_15145 [Novosphingobium sp. NBM11]|uniref:hypothetical protein n=1 Tax=Novosphingobium sp. NBM11 TaxID=2596914 RepID=UPI0018924A6D|nr:hypothetical protein [Novosphingobium sp. NBM11]MBF5091322.1 hypothetical protein [Novosphingobium sp. NBM11]